MRKHQRQRERAAAQLAARRERKRVPQWWTPAGPIPLADLNPLRQAVAPVVYSGLDWRDGTLWVAGKLVATIRYWEITSDDK